MTDVDSDQSKDQRYAQYVRAANIVICIIAIAYFLSFIRIITTRVPWFVITYDLFRQVLFGFPQVFLLLTFLLKEALSHRSTSHHVIVLMSVLAVTVLGYFWSMAMIGR